VLEIIKDEILMIVKSNSKFSIRSIYKQGKTTLGRILPPFILKPIDKYLDNRRAKRNINLSVKEVFTNIYQNNQWGGMKGEYFSGSGSIDPSIVKYSKIIRDFIIDHNIKKVVDLGCGDFRAGRQIILPGVNYIGIDIVGPLIDDNKLKYSSENVSFLCLDIIKDELPEGQLCLIRQVLQHLSNQEILQILGKIKRYQYVIVTEHMPSPSTKIIPNKDKPHGGDIRLLHNSAVYLDISPFNTKISKILLDTEIKRYCYDKRERLRTFLIEHK
jgi:SAM-dependent methyltransferase